MFDPFLSAKLLLFRARDHIEALDANTQAFLAAEPYYRVIEQDVEADYDLHKIRFKAEIPEVFSINARDALGSLRDALDHMVYASAVLIRGGDPKHTKFPIADSPVELENDIKSRCKDVPQLIISVIRQRKPYRENENDNLL